MGLSTTYTKAETDFLIQQLEIKTSSGYQGDLLKTDAAPTTKGFYALLETGIYPNLGNINAQAGKLNFASFDGTTWSKVEVAIAFDDSNYFKKVYGFMPKTDLNQMPASAPNVANTYINQFETINEITTLKSITIKGKGVISIYKANKDNSHIVFIKDVDLGANIDLHTINFSETIYIGENQRIGISAKPTGVSEFYFITPEENGLKAFNSASGQLEVLTIAYGYQLSALSVSQQIIALQTQLIDVMPIKALDDFDLSGANPATYYGNNFQTFSAKKIIKEISIKGSGFIKFFKCDADYSNKELVLSYDFGEQNIVHNIETNIVLEAGKRLIFQASNGTLFYASAESTDVAGYASDSDPVTPIPLYFAYGYRVANFTETTPSVAVKEDAITTSLYKTDFSANDIWQTNNWEIVNGVAQNLANGKDKNLHLPLIFNINKRRAKFRITPSANSDFRIHLKANIVTESEGGSLFGLNFGTGKMQIFKVLTTWSSPDITSTGVSETEILKEAQMIPFVAGREYTVELRYYKTKHTLTIADSVTAEKSVLEFDGWAGGRQNQQYSFYVYSGGQVKISDFEVFGVDNVENLFVGDSITEGVMVVDKTKRWWEQMTPFLKGVTATSARGGHTTGDVLAKFDTELKLLKPKRIIFLIGINNGGSPTSHFTDILNKCLDNNIEPIFCYHTAFNNGSHLPTLNNMLSVIPTKYLGFRFDLATSTNNDGVNANPSLFYDGLHPIESGCTEMAKRLFVDTDILK